MEFLQFSLGILNASYNLGKQLLGITEKLVTHGRKMDPCIQYWGPLNVHMGLLDSLFSQNAVKGPSTHELSYHLLLFCLLLLYLHN